MRISIYQLKPRHQDLYKLSFDEFKAQSGNTPFIHQYNKIFTGVVDDSIELEDLFDILSNDLPDTYKGKDFGVSDVIGIETDGKVLKAGNYYYCDNIGWTKARQFTEQNESLEESASTDLLIDPEVSENVDEFINTPDEELDFDLIKTVCDEYNSDSAAMSKLNQMDDIDAEIANHKAFYKKWRPLANRVRRFDKTITTSALPGIKGHGQLNNSVRIKAQQMLRDISYGFPYGWQFG